MFGFSYESLDTIGRWAMIGGIGFGVLALVLTAISSVALYTSGNIFQREAADFQTKAAERIAVLNNETAQARLEQERLKLQLAWRDLTPEDQAELERMLSPSPSSVTIQYVANDPEATKFAIQIGKLFQRAKWQVGMQSLTYSGTMIFGLWIPGPDSPETRLIRDAFTAIGESFSTDDPPESGIAMKIGSNGVTEAVLLVGSKSPP